MARPFSGMLFYDASQLNFTTSAGSATYSRQGVGDVSINLAASTTAFIHMGLADVKRPFLSYPAPPGFGTVPTSNELQEVFGTAAGGPGNPLGPGFGQTSSIPWGISVIDIFACYSVTTGALTTATLGMSRVTYVENTAISITAAIAATGVATATTAAANAPHVAKVSAATPLTFESTDFTDLLVELNLVVAVGNTARVYGMGMHVAVEYS